MPEPLPPFILLRDAAAPVIEKLRPTVSRENIFLAFVEFDDAIDAIAKFGSVIEAPVGSLRAVRNVLAEHFAHPRRDF
jgi:hypothetical protein